MTLKASIPGLRLGNEIAALLHEDTARHWAVVLPGMLGVEDVIRHVQQDRSLLRIDGAISGNEAANSVAEILQDQGFEAAPDAANALELWALNGRAQYHGVPAVVFVESAHLLDCPTTALVEQVLRDSSAQVVMAVPSSVELPEIAVRAQRTGALNLWDSFLLTPNELEGAIRRTLGGEVSSTALHRLGTLSGGHAILAQQAIEIAQDTGTLENQGGLWTWSADEQKFVEAVAHRGPDLLTGFGAREQELMVLLAVAGRLPYLWVVEHFGDGTMRTLRAQKVVGIDSVGPLAFRDVRFTAEFFRHASHDGVRSAEATRLWYSVGQHISTEAAGPGSMTALVWWRARAEGRVDLSSVTSVVTYAMSRGWYKVVRDLLAFSGGVATQDVLLKARAELALGRVDEAFDTLESAAQRCAQARHSAGSDASANAALRAEARDILLVTRRWGVCHPDRARPIARLVEQGWDSPLLADSDAILARCDETDITSVVEAVTAARKIRARDEAATLQLVLGAHLGLRRHPQIGRFVLSSLVDELGRDGGDPDTEELAVALLLLVTTVQGWSIDMFHLNVQTWHGRRISDPALPAVADVVASVVAMQRDQMQLAYLYALSAGRTFGTQDRFGLRPLAAAVAAASSAYVDQSSTQRVRAEFSAQYGDSAIDQGIPYLRRLAQGMVMVGNGQPMSVIAEELVVMAADAAEAGEWAQEQQLLVLALLGGSIPAARVVKTRPWKNNAGRPRMIGMMAQAFLADDPRQSLDIAEILLHSGAEYLGLTVLSLVWRSPQSSDHEISERVVRLVRACARAKDRGSWLVSTFGITELDQRERDVLRGLNEGQSTRDIAAGIHLSQRTIEATVSALLKRFRCSNRLELLALDLVEE